jgi:hypothetical protein
MNPRDDSDEDDKPYDDSGDSDDNDPVVRELRAELLRLESQLDQILAGEREHGEEVARLETQMVELQGMMDAIRDRYRQKVRLWGWTAFFYGIALGMWLS